MIVLVCGFIVMWYMLCIRLMVFLVIMIVGVLVLLLMSVGIIDVLMMCSFCRLCMCSCGLMMVSVLCFIW